MEIALGIILILISVALIVAVLLQSGKSRNLSGAIAGGSDTFFSKSSGNTKEKIISRLTTILAIVFVVLVLVMYISQSGGSYSGNYEEPTADATKTSEVTSEDTSDVTSTVTAGVTDEK